jgi:hypothetical protein
MLNRALSPTRNFGFGGNIMCDFTDRDDLEEELKESSCNVTMSAFA